MVFLKNNGVSFLKHIPRLWSDPSKLFLVITCAIWLRLQFRILDSAWFFSAHLLVFHARGRIFEPRIGFWDLWSTFWPGDLFEVKNGSRKKSICDGIILWWQFRGNSQTQMNSIIYRTHLGRLLCPKTSLFNYFQRIYHFPGKLENAPACDPGHSLFPLWAIAYSP